MKISVVLASVAAVSALTACSASPAEPELRGDVSPAAVGTTDPGPKMDARYGSVEELRDAAVEAGLPCGEWSQSNRVELAAESGDCDDESVLSTFATQSDLDAQVERYRSMSDEFADMEIETDTSLVGPNWIIHSPSAQAVQDNLGGTLLS